MKFFCDIDYDPFLVMEDQKKVYGTYMLLSGTTFAHPNLLL